MPDNSEGISYISMPLRLYTEFCHGNITCSSVRCLGGEQGGSGISRAAAICSSGERDMFARWMRNETQHPGQEQTKPNSSVHSQEEQCQVMAGSRVGCIHTTTSSPYFLRRSVCHFSWWITNRREEADTGSNSGSSSPPPLPLNRRSQGESLADS